MPYLNWRSGETRPEGSYRQEITQEEGSFPRREHLLRLTLSPEALEVLAQRLEELYSQGCGELRIDLPEGWILFWKSREEESRLLVAHPQPGEWVTTVALEAKHGMLLASSLRQMKKGESRPVSQGGIIGRVSNVEIVIAVE